jgi:hypothetical protein
MEVTTRDVLLSLGLTYVALVMCALLSGIIRQGLGDVWGWGITLLVFAPGLLLLWAGYRMKH